MKKVWIQLLPLFAFSFLAVLLFGINFVKAENEETCAFNFNDSQSTDSFGNELVSTHIGFQENKWSPYQANSSLYHYNTTQEWETLINFQGGNGTGGVSGCFWGKQPNNGGHLLYLSNSDGSKKIGIQFGHYGTYGLVYPYFWENYDESLTIVRSIQVSTTYYNWNYYCFSFGTAGVYLYVNGEEQNYSSWSNSVSHADYTKIGMYGLNEHDNEYDIDDFVVYDTTLTSDLMSRYYSTELNYTAPSNFPVINLNWAGYNVQQGEIGSFWSVPVYYDFCSYYTEIQTNGLYLQMTNWNYGIAEKVVVEPGFVGALNCRGTTYLTGQITATSTAISTTTVIAYYDVMGGDSLGETSVFDLQIKFQGTSDNYLDNAIVSPLKIYQTSGTSTLPFNYNLTSLDYSDGQICMFNNDSQTKLPYCYNLGSTTPSGMGYVDIPNANNDFVFNGKYKAYNSNGIAFFESEVFTITWPNSLIPDLSLYLSTSTESFVCSTDEWASTSTYLGLNLTLFRCNSLKSVVDIAERISEIPKKFGESFVNMVKFFFPLNIPSKILESWETSASSTVPAEFDFLDVSDNDGQITSSIPSTWTGGNSTSTFVLFGTSTMAAGSSKMIDFYNAFKNFSVYLQWFIFIFGLIAWGKGIYQDLTTDIHKE